MPFILLTTRGGGLERNPTAARYLELLGNVTFLERPFHPTTLISLAKAALRGRRRQYDARARLEELHLSADRYRTLFESIDAGFCIIAMLFDEDGRPNDYRFIEVNPAFIRQTGIEDAVGRRVGGQPDRAGQLADPGLRAGRRHFGAPGAATRDGHGRG